MTGMMEDRGGALSPVGEAKVARLLAAVPHRRLLRINIDGSKVWIKRFDTEMTTLARRLHNAFSPLLPATFLRASPVLDPAGLALREARKSEAFQSAGFPTPAILWHGHDALAMSEVAPIGEPLLRQMRKSDSDRHEDLLVGMTEALGRAHAAGLCHGRPHPRDMFLHSDGSWGFFDFEEEPEAVMPLASAQARDLWLMFMQISNHALSRETKIRAFKAWRMQAPAQIMPELQRIVATFSLLLPGLRALRPLGLGSDGLRLLRATSFLRAALRGTIADHSTPDRIGTPT